LPASIKDYWILTKPKIWGLLVFTGVIAMLVAFRDTGKSVNLINLLIGTSALTLGSASANVLTNYHDRDIDAIMERTKDRPIPSGKIKPKNALAFGLSMALLSVLLSLYFNFLSTLFMIIGLMDNVVVYSILLKRKTWFNIILGGISGGMPVLVGYAYVANGISLLALYMAVLVMVWIPTHIWSLAVTYREDYRRAGVPMLPVVYGEKVATFCIAAASSILAIFSLTVIFFASVSLFYLVTTLALGSSVIGYSAKLLLDRSGDTAWKLFKITSPYLMLIFLALAVNVWFF
jgi:protoheme IX farnesyltransferase